MNPMSSEPQQEQQRISSSQVPRVCKTGEQGRSRVSLSFARPFQEEDIGTGLSRNINETKEQQPQVPLTLHMYNRGSEYAESSCNQPTETCSGGSTSRVTLTDHGSVPNTSDNAMYDIDLEQQTGPLQPHHHLETDQSQDQSHTSASIVRRLSQHLSRQASSLWRGDPVTTTEKDEKRLEDEKRAWEPEPQSLNEEEEEMLKRGLFNWSELKNWRFWVRKEWWHWYLILLVCGAIAVLFAIYRGDIVEWLTPYAKDLKELPGGWAIPIGIIVVLSVSPLFGAEVICVLCGLVWGLWIGFGIVCAGTFLGEMSFDFMGDFFLFKYTLKGYATKLEKKHMTYALLAHVIRKGGFIIALIARCAVQGYFMTAILSTCGTPVWIFAIVTLLNLPKQLALVYLGVLIASHDQSSKDTIVSCTVLALSVVVTLLAMWYIYRKMNEARLPVWRARRSAMQGQDVDAMRVWPSESPLDEKTDTLPIHR